MADTKSKAMELASDQHPHRVLWQMEAAAELRRLDAVEAERDALRAEVERLKTAAGRPPAST